MYFPEEKLHICGSMFSVYSGASCVGWGDRAPSGKMSRKEEGHDFPDNKSMKV